MGAVEGGVVTGDGLGIVLEKKKKRSKGEERNARGKEMWKKGVELEE
jgi:hypothetical protein